MRLSKSEGAVAVGLLLLGGIFLGPALALDGPLVGPTTFICGTVQNEVGWVLADIEVLAVGAGTTSAGDVQSVLTGPTGAFVLEVPKDDEVIVIRDSKPPALRGGAAYAPQQQLLSLHLDPLLATCGGNPNSKDLGTIVLDAPEQGFVEVTVTDRVVASTTPVVDALVSLSPSAESQPSPLPVSPFVALTDAAGVARLACLPPEAADNPTASVKATKVSYQLGAHSVLCTEAVPGGSAASVWFRLWRQGVQVVATVQAAETPPALLSGASVFVARAPAGLLDLATTCPIGSGYICSATTNEAGVALLNLPWATGDHRLRSQKTGLSRDDQLVVLASTDVVKPVAFTLSRSSQTFSQKITNIHGVAQSGVTATFDGPTPTSFTTGADGFVNVTLKTGDYTLELNKDGFNLRQCTFTLNPDGTVTALAPAHCFKLIAEGKGAATGSVRDRLTSALIVGATVCKQGTLQCATFQSDGSYNIELDPGTHTLDTTAPADWVNAGAGVIVTIALDGVAVVAAANLDRVTKPTTITVNDGATAIDSAFVCADMTSIAVFTDVCALTGLLGDVTLALPWTKRATSPDYDVGLYVVNADRHSLSPHFDTGVLAGGLSILNTASGASGTITLSAEATRTASVTVVDKHNGATLAATVTATPPAGISCASPYTCSGTALTLPSGHAFNVCAAATNYDATGATNCATLAAGLTSGSISLQVRRTSRTVVVTVADSHVAASPAASGFVVGLSVTAAGQGGFSCAAGQAVAVFDCGPKTSNADGKVTLKLPWTNSGELSLTTPSASKTVVLKRQTVQPGTNEDVLENSVPLLAASKAHVMAPGAATVNVELRPSRSLATISGAFTDPANAAIAPLANPRVVPATERRSEIAAFNCNPLASDSTLASYADCAFRAASGTAYTISLPAGGSSYGVTQGSLPTQLGEPDHTWKLLARADGFYFENATQAKQGGPAVNFVLWPKTFTATITVNDGLAPGLHPTPPGCPGAIPIVLNVKLMNLASGAETQQNVAQGGADCQVVATFSNVPWTRTQAPAALPSPNHEQPDDQNDPFLILAVAPSHAPCVTVALLGPQAATASCAVQHAGVPSINVGGLIQGRAGDANSAQSVGAVGVQVTAVRQLAPCTLGGGTFTTFTGPDGRYALPVGCAGTYDVTFSDATLGALARYATLVAGDQAVAALPGVLNLDRTLARTTVVTTVSITNDIGVTLAGREVALASATTSGFNPSCFTGTSCTSIALPWGDYVFRSSEMTTVSHHLVLPNLALLKPGDPGTGVNLQAVRLQRCDPGVEGTPKLCERSQSLVATAPGNQLIATVPGTWLVAAPDGTFLQSQMASIAIPSNLPADGTWTVIFAPGTIIGASYEISGTIGTFSVGPKLFPTTSVPPLGDSRLTAVWVFNLRQGTPGAQDILAAPPLPPISSVPELQQARLYYSNPAA